MTIDRREPADLRPFATGLSWRERAGWMGFTLLAYFLFAGVMLWRYDGDVTGFVVAGDRFVAPASLAHPLRVTLDSDGYDGQFYYRLALDPATTRRVDNGITLDSPPVRAQRIVYPVLAWVASGGNGALVPYALVALNLAALVGIAGLATGLAARFGLPARLGVAIAFYPGFLLSLARDTTEIVATFFAVAALSAATRNRAGLAAVLASIAVLTRETTLLYLAGFGLVEGLRCWRRRTVSPALLAYFLPVLAYGAWQLALRWIWSGTAVGDVGPRDLALPPLLGYLVWLKNDAVAALATPIRYRLVFNLLASVAVAAFFVWTARGAVKGGLRPLVFVVPWALYAALAALFTSAVWNEPYGFLRILCDLYVPGLALLIANRQARALRAMIPWIATMWLATIGYA